jgi:hypothetical protein
MLLFETLSALFMMVGFIAGVGLLVVDRQARRAPVREESRAWRRPPL